MMFRSIQRLFLLSRPAMMPWSISVPIAGALTAKPGFPAIEIIGLGIIGVFAHLSGFILNDIIDYELDRISSLRHRSLLVAGHVSKKQAWVTVFVSTVATLLIYSLLLKGTHAGLLLLGLSMLFSIIYNLWSKRGRVPRLFPELALAISLGLLALSGSLLILEELSSQALLFSLSISLVLLQVNSVPSGLKDLKTDIDFGARSLVIATGSVVDSDGKLIISRLLWIYSFMLQGLIISCVLALVLVFQPHWVLAMLSVILAIYAGFHLRKILLSTTLPEFRGAIPFLGGFYNYLAVSFLLLERMPILLAVFYVLALCVTISHPMGFVLRMRRHRHQVLVEETDV